MANKKRLIDANALDEKLETITADVCQEICEGFYKYGLTRPLIYLAISEMPTVDAVEVVHGEWLYGERNKVKRTLIVECSECGAIFNLPMFTFGMNYNYCPNCGAKMDGDGNG